MADTLLFTFDVGADGVEAMFDVFVATVNLVDVVNTGRAFCRHGGNQHSNTRTDVWRSHVIAFELAGVVVTNYNCTVWITKDDLRAHVNQFIHEEKTRFEHLLVDEHRAFCLCGYHEQD